MDEEFRQEVLEILRAIKRDLDRIAGAIETSPVGEARYPYEHRTTTQGVEVTDGER